MQKIELSILPQGKLNPIIRCSQGDVGRQFQVELYNEDMTAKYVLDGTETLTVEGHKPDGNFFSFDLPATTGSVITVTTTEQMTACYGDVYGEIRIEKGDTLLGTANFTLSIEIGASATDTVSVSALQFIDALRNEMREAVEDTEEYAGISKAWAVGPNGSGTGTDTNNSKYYAQQAGQSATDASGYATNASNSANAAAGSATDAKNWAVGTSGTGTGTDTNNAKYYSGLASNAKTDAETAKADAISAKNDAVSAKNDAISAKDTAVNAKNDAVSAKDDAVIAKNAAEVAEQKIENMTVSAQQLPAGSTPTVQKTVGSVINLEFGIPKGDKGDTGNDGVSPTASVSQLDPNTVQFTVTDAQGTTTATLASAGIDYADDTDIDGMTY